MGVLDLPGVDLDDLLHESAVLHEMGGSVGHCCLSRPYSEQVGFHDLPCVEKWHR